MAKRVWGGNEEARTKEKGDCLKEQGERHVNPKTQSEDSRGVDSEKESLTCRVHQKDEIKNVKPIITGKRIKIKAEIIDSPQRALP